MDAPKFMARVTVLALGIVSFFFCPKRTGRPIVTAILTQMVPRGMSLNLLESGCYPTTLWSVRLAAGC